jgi:GTPase SAR1 family protein
LQLPCLRLSVFTVIVGALIVYDITDQDSFTKVNTWLKELRKYLPQETPIIIAGNKCDVQNRVIPLEEAEKYEI